MSKNLLILALFAVLLVSTQAKSLKRRQAKLSSPPVLAQTQRSIDCLVELKLSNGATFESFLLNKDERTASKAGLRDWNDQGARVIASGKCSGCSIVLWEDYGFQGQYLAYNLDAKRDVHLDKYHFTDGEGQTYAKWSDMLSGYQAYC